MYQRLLLPRNLVGRGLKCVLNSNSGGSGGKNLSQGAKVLGTNGFSSSSSIVFQASTPPPGGSNGNNRSGGGVGGGSPGFDIYARDSFGEYVYFPDIVSEESFKVPTFDGSVWVSSPLNVKLKPAGTMEYPNLDRAFVKLLSREDAKGEGVTMNVTQEGSKLLVDADYD